MGCLDILRTSTEKALKDCRQHPRRCFRQLLIDGMVIVLAYAVLVYLVDGASIDPMRAARFYGLFVVMAYVLRYLDVDFQEQLTRVAGFQLGTKLFSALA